MPEVMASAWVPTRHASEPAEESSRRVETCATWLCEVQLTYEDSPSSCGPSKAAKEEALEITQGRVDRESQNRRRYRRIQYGTSVGSPSRGVTGAYSGANASRTFPGNPPNRA